VGHAVGRAFTAGLRRHDLSPVHFGVLNALDGYGALHQRRLATLLGVDRQTLANVAADLESRDLIQRHRPERDRRTQVLTITRAGLALLHNADTEAVAIEQALFAALPPHERDALFAALRHLAHSDPFGDLLDPPQSDRPAPPANHRPSAT
jgi:DNA-binding MarR family transcriptional regulator